MTEDVWELTRAACPAMPQQRLRQQPGKRDASPMRGLQKSWIPFSSRRRMSSEPPNPLFRNLFLFLLSTQERLLLCCQCSAWLSFMGHWAGRALQHREVTAGWQSLGAGPCKTSYVAGDTSAYVLGDSRQCAALRHQAAGAASVVMACRCCRD